MFICINMLTMDCIIDSNVNKKNVKKAQVYPGSDA